MSQKKDKKIKKIRRVRILPSIISFLIFSFIAFVALFIILNAYGSQSLSNSLAKNVTIAKEVNDLYQEDEIKTYRDEQFIQLKSMNSNLKNIILLDSNQAIKDYHIEEEFDYNEIRNVSSLLEDTSYQVYLVPGNTSFFSYDESSISLNISQVLFHGLDYIKNIKNPSEDIIDTLDMYCVFHNTSSDVYTVVEMEYTFSAFDALSISISFWLVFTFFIVVLIFLSWNLVTILLDKRQVNQALYTDSITGDRNYVWFTNKARRYIKKTKKGIIHYAIVNLRMEKYREYCACYGVASGEELVENMYLKLKESIEKKELAVHYEKADFILLLLADDMEYLEQRVNQMMILLDQVSSCKTYFSAGICVSTHYKDDIDYLFNNASLARAKAYLDSENNIFIYNDEIQKQQKWISTVENDMERALLEEEFKIYIQPKYSPRKESLGGAEALIRWIHPTEGFVPPGRFIPIFEENGFITKIDDYMISGVAKLQSRWIKEGKKVVPISVNVSRVHFMDENLASHIADLVDRYDCPHEFIELELTESAFFENKKTLLETVSKMKELGFSVSMDDFGAGYSSLNSLKELPMDVIKLDAEFFRGDENEKGTIIIKRAIDMAKALGIRVVAEGVETRQQVDFLCTTRCDLIQGYYFAKPMPNEEYEKELPIKGRKKEPKDQQE